MINRANFTFKHVSKTTPVHTVVMPMQNDRLTRYHAINLHDRGCEQYVVPTFIYKEVANKQLNALKDSPFPVKIHTTSMENMEYTGAMLRLPIVVVTNITFDNENKTIWYDACFKTNES